MKHKTIEQIDMERAKFRLACDYYSQLILVGEEDGESWIYWDTRSLSDTEALLESALAYIKAQNVEDKGKCKISVKEQWKPSDEQMKILNEVLNFAANHENPHWNDYIFGTLHNLIGQLKKLKE